MDGNEAGTVPGKGAGVWRMSFTFTRERHPEYRRAKNSI